MLQGRAVREQAASLLRRLGAAARPGAGGLPHADALLLAPVLPTEAAVAGRDPSWDAALRHWRIPPVAVPSARLVVASAAALPDLDVRPTVLVLRGRGRWTRLRRDGYAVTRYRVRMLSGGVVLAAPDRRGLALARRVWGPVGVRGRGARDVVRDLVRRALRPAPVIVAVRHGGALPAAVAALGLPGPGRPPPYCLAVDVRDDRRRAVFVVARPGRATAVVKVSRSPRHEPRAAREQRILALLPGHRGNPQPLGSGRAGPAEWSAETAVCGEPLREYLSRPRVPVRPVLELLTRWLEELAAGTAAPADWSAVRPGAEPVALRGPASDLAGLLPGLGPVPTVLVHGDLASGHNVLVDGAGRPAVVDWETASERGLPLLDLVPLLALSLARAAGSRGPEAQAGHVLALAAGDGADGAWFLRSVAGYARRLGLPSTAVGPLALLAWGHQASMSEVRRELQAAAGVTDPPRVTAGELVLAGWRERVGTDWAALGRAR